MGAVRCISCPCQSAQFTMLSEDSHPTLLESGSRRAIIMLLHIQRAKVIDLFNTCELSAAQAKICQKKHVYIKKKNPNNIATFFYIDLH